MNKKSFASVGADVSIQRSTFDIPHKHLTTANFGKVVPFYCQEVLPGDTFSMQTNMLVRMSTPLFPVMDDAYVEYNYFFVPDRLVWSHFNEFMGENKYGAWTQPVEYIIPHGEVRPSAGDVYDHFGIPTYSGDAEFLSNFGFDEAPIADVSILPIRAFWLIWNEWFRNENTTEGVLVNTGDDVDRDEIERYRSLPSASKPFDAFTSALPAPQKGDPVSLGGIDVPVVTFPASGAQIETLSSAKIYERYGSPLAFFTGGANSGNSQAMMPAVRQQSPGDNYVVMSGAQTVDTTIFTDYSAGTLGPINLKALTSEFGFSVNDLRQAFAMQRLLEVQARCGSRYVEIVAASFGVKSSDARLMRSEYLGGSTARIQMQQVVQQSERTSAQESPLGRLAAFSKTATTNHDFTKSFTEHGYVIGVMVARHNLTYQQGLAPMWSRRGRYDLYWPNFAHIGEQPIKNKVLFLSGVDEVDEAPFGYQEPYWDYRYKPNMVTGAFRSTVPVNLDEWHYADVYNDTPTLSASWMAATGITVDRTLAVDSSQHDQLLFDISCNLTATRPMPLYSVPGLIDHF